jgi:high-affinity K+ transport system ATPase subunit B
MKTELELIVDKRYQGKFVALRSLTDRTVVAWGDDPSEVGTLAAEKGVEEPIVFYVPQEDVPYVYRLSKFEL